MGADTFVFAAGDGSAHIADFEEGETIRISGVSGDFAGLVIEQYGANAVIRHGDGDTITLRGVSADSLDNSNFKFRNTGDTLTGGDSDDTLTGGGGNDWL